MSEKATHTPGPWTLDTALTQIRSGQGLIADVGDGLPPTKDFAYLVADANARLIAAAPDMLAALHAAEELLRDGGCVPISGVTWQTIKAAIAKAEGQS